MRHLMILALLATFFIQSSFADEMGEVKTPCGNTKDGEARDNPKENLALLKQKQRLKRPKTVTQ